MGTLRKIGNYEKTFKQQLKPSNMRMIMPMFTIKRLVKKAPSLGWHVKENFIDLIGTKEHLGWVSPYRRPKL